MIVEPNPGEGFEFVNEIKGGVIPKEYIPGVLKGCEAEMLNGIKAQSACRPHHMNFPQTGEYETCRWCVWITGVKGSQNERTSNFVVNVGFLVNSVYFIHTQQIQVARRAGHHEDDIRLVV